MTRYLSVEQVLQLNHEIIHRWGGHAGVRDLGLLESAVYRMQATYGGEDLYGSIFEKAAAMLESLCKNHPFIDGNKRTSFVASVTFLELNGYTTHFDKDEAEEMVIHVAKGASKFVEIVSFLQAHSKK